MAACLAAALVAPIPSVASAAIAGRGQVAGATAANKDFTNFAEASSYPTSLWTDGTTMWVAEHLSSDTDRVFAYDLATATRDTTKELVASGFTILGGLWSDGTTMWVGGRAGTSDRKLYAYTLSTRVRDNSKDVSIDVLDPRDMWSDGTTIWVGDYLPSNVYGFNEGLNAYNLSTGARDIAKSFTKIDLGHTYTPGFLPIAGVIGLWSDGKTMWMIDDYTRDGVPRVNAFDLATKVRRPNLEFDLPGLSEGWQYPRSMTSDGETLWILRFREIDGNLVLHLVSYVLPGSPAAPTGLETTVGDGQVSLSWVAVPAADVGSSAIVSYEVQTRPDIPGEGWTAVSRASRLAVSETVTGLVNEVEYEVRVRAVNSESLSDWTAATATPSLVPAEGTPGKPTSLVVSLGSGPGMFSLSWQAPEASTPPVAAVTGYRVRYRDAQRFPPGAWMVLEELDDLVTTKDLEGLLGLARYDFSVQAVNSVGAGGVAAESVGGVDLKAAGIGASYHVRGLWSNSETLWVAARQQDTAQGLYAFDAVTGQRKTTEDFTTLQAAEVRPNGIWSDGTTMWVLDDTVDRALAFDMGSKALVPDKGFTVAGSRGLASYQDAWSDGKTLWVMDSNWRMVRARDLVTKARRTDKEFSLDATYDAVWSDGTRVWVADGDTVAGFGGYAITFPGTAVAGLKAYSLSDGSRDAASDVTLPASVESISALWSYGDTAWYIENVPDGSDYLRAFRLPQWPGLPGIPDVVSGASQLTVSWAGADGAAGYELQRRGDSASAWTAVTRSDSSLLTETVTGLTNGTYYEVRVRAVGADAKKGEWVYATGTPVAVGAPGAPTGLEVSGEKEPSAEGGGDRALAVEWNAPSSQGPFTYGLRYRTLGGATRSAWTAVAVSSGTSTRVAGLTAGARYEVHVRAIDSNSRSGPWVVGQGSAGEGFYDLGSAETSLRGIWSDGETMWVADGTETDLLRAYDMGTKYRKHDADIGDLPLKFPNGVWGDASNLYVVQSDDNAADDDIANGLFAVDRSTRASVANSLSVTASGGSNAVMKEVRNTAPYGAWSDGTTVWVSDKSNPTIFAYTLSSGIPDSSKDFPAAQLRDPDALLDSVRSVQSPSALWSNGTTMWLGDWVSNRIYAFNMATRARDQLRDIVFDFSVTISGLWGAGGSDTKLFVVDNGDAAGSAPRILARVLPDPPSAPLNPRSDPGDRQVVLEWDAVTDTGSSSVKSYEIRSTELSNGGGNSVGSRDVAGRDVVGRGVVGRGVVGRGVVGVQQRTVVDREDPTATSETVTGLVNGRQYRFEVRARNSETVSEWVRVDETPVGPASGPRSLTAVPSGSGSLLVTWAAPLRDGGSAVTGYEVQYRQMGAVDWAVASSVVGLSTQLDGLTNGTSHDVRVRAETGYGDNVWAEVSATPLVVPGEPWQVSALRGGSRELVVGWVSPGTPVGGSAVLDFAVRYRAKASGGEPAGVWVVDTSSVAASPWSVDGLVNGVVYEVAVRARNTAGSGPWSMIAEGVPATEPARPRNLSAAAGAGELVLEWAAPASDGGSALIGYETRHRVRSPQGDWVDDGTVAPDASPLQHTVFSLVDGTTYDVCVRAVNDVGEGDCASATGTPVAVPSQPPGVSADAGDAAVTLSWSAAFGNGSDVLDYRVRHRVRSPQGAWVVDGTVAHDASPLELTVTGLRNGTAYDVSVQARNSIGHGPASTTDAVPSTVPDPPSNLIIDRGDTELVVSWSAGGDGGRAVTGYDVRHRIAGTVPWSSPQNVDAADPPPLSVTMGGLRNGVSYEVCVRARNANGDGGCTTDSATPATLPGAATNVAAVPADRAATLSWGPPANNGGAPVSRYEIEYLAGGGQVRRLNVAPPTQPHTRISTEVSSLTNGQPQRLQVRAVNAVGAGPWADAAVTPLAVPGRVESLSLEERDTRLVATWAPPANSVDTQVSGYEVEYAPKNPPQPWTSAPVSDTTATITGLAGGSTYKVRVRATNAAPTPGPWTTIEGTPAILQGLAIANASALENTGTLTFTVTLGGIGFDEVQVDYTTTDGTATSGDDYDHLTSTLRIPQGETTATIIINLIDDTVTEPDETFTITLADPINAQLSRQTTAEGTIIDNDNPIVLRRTTPRGGPGPGGGGGGGGGAPPTPTTSFADTNPRSVHTPNIEALHAAGITTGCAQNPLRYCPHQPVTRAQMATFLTRALNLQHPAQPAGFTDTNPRSVHTPNIEALHAAGITTGCAQNPLRYCPHQPVTRAQMATFLTRALNLDN